MTRLNTRELALMESPVRRLAQRHLELRRFRRMLRRAGIDLVGKEILEAGCGNGFGLELLTETFRPGRLAGIDLMPEQIERARRRDLTAEISVSDITAIPYPEASFDAVFVFAILHHVPRWRDALVELARVLRPGGALVIEELCGDAVDLADRWLGTSHPPAARFDWPSFRSGLAGAGLDTVAEAAVVPHAVRAFVAVKRLRD